MAGFNGIAWFEIGADDPARAEILNQGIQPIGPVHAPTLKATPDIPPRAGNDIADGDGGTTQPHRAMRDGQG